MAAQSVPHTTYAANVILEMILSIPAVINDQCMVPPFLMIIRLPTKHTAFGIFCSNTWYTVVLGVS